MLVKCCAASLPTVEGTAGKHSIGQSHERTKAREQKWQSVQGVS